MSHQLLPARLFPVGRKQELGAEQLGLEGRYLDTGCGDSRQCLNHCAQYQGILNSSLFVTNI